MNLYSTRQAAKELGIDTGTLSRYISSGKVPSPKTNTAGGMTIHLWTKKEIEHIRKLLPRIANGRKTRYERLREKHKKQTRKKRKK
jgi:predicted site-specific integrase-resolvase